MGVEARLKNTGNLLLSSMVNERLPYVYDKQTIDIFAGSYNQGISYVKIDGVAKLSGVARGLGIVRLDQFGNYYDNNFYIYVSSTPIANACATLINNTPVGYTLICVSNDEPRDGVTTMLSDALTSLGFSKLVWGYRSAWTGIAIKGKDTPIEEQYVDGEGANTKIYVTIETPKNMIHYPLDGYSNSYNAIPLTSIANCSLIPENGLELDEATNNIFVNGNFQNGLTGWSNAQDYSTSTIIDTPFGKGVRITRENGNGGAWALYPSSQVITVGAGSTWTFSFKYRTTRGTGFPMYVGFWINDNGANRVNVPRTDYDLGDGWYQAKATYTFVSAFSGAVEFGLNSQQDYTTVEISDMQLEQKPFSTAYVNGSRSVPSTASLPLPVTNTDFTIFGYAKFGRPITTTTITSNSRYLSLMALTSYSNVLLNKSPTSNHSISNPTKATDGISNVTTNYSDVGQGISWIQFDLGSNYNIDALKVWHYYGDTRSYHDVVFQLSKDSTFAIGVTTVFNNDTDNTLGLGIGTDSEYVETSSGKTVNFTSVSARYIRLYSNGNTINTSSHYQEIEAYGVMTPYPCGLKFYNNSNVEINPWIDGDGWSEPHVHSNGGIYYANDVWMPFKIERNAGKINWTIYKTPSLVYNWQINIPSYVVFNTLNFIAELNTSFKNVTIYNRMLTAGEITKMVNGGFNITKNGYLNTRKLIEKQNAIPIGGYYFPLDTDALDYYNIASTPALANNLLFENNAVWVGKAFTNMISSTPAYANWNGQDIVVSNYVDSMGDNVQKINSASWVGVNALWSGGATGETIANVYTYSLFVRGKGNAQIIAHQARGTVGEDIAVGSNVITLHTENWQRLSVTMTANQVSQNLLVQISAGAGNYVEVKKPQFENKYNYSAYSASGCGNSSLNFNFYSSIGMNWSGDFTISYWKYPLATSDSASSLIAYNLESLGCNTNSVGGGYNWWGKNTGVKSVTLSSATPNAYANDNDYFNDWQLVTVRKTGTTIRLNVRNKVLNVNTTGNARVLAVNGYVNQFGYDFRMGGYDNTNPSNAFYKDLLVFKRYLTDAEVNDLYTVQMRGYSDKLQIIGSLSENMTLV